MPGPAAGTAGICDILEEIHAVNAEAWLAAAVHLNVVGPQAKRVRATVEKDREIAEEERKIARDSA
jgi:hypothetical protein